MNAQQTALYRHFSSEGNLLYVGISLSVVNRLSQHKISEWSLDIARVDIEHFDNRKLALDAERAAIKKENPLYNKTHNQKKEPDIKDSNCMIYENIMGELILLEKGYSPIVINKNYESDIYRQAKSIFTFNKD